MNQWCHQSKGMKLLEKMGYKGGGLGKNQQGIVAPIEAKLRPKNTGIGYHHYTNTVPVHVVVEDELYVSRSKKKLARKRKYIAPEEDTGFGVVHQVIDMRGPQVLDLTNIEDLNAQEQLKRLRLNMKLIVDLIKGDVENHDRDLWNERENVVYFQKEKDKLRKDADSLKKQLDTFQDINGVIEWLRNEDSLGSLTMDSLTGAFDDLQRKYVDDYKRCKLSSIACSFALPLLNGVFRGWDPLWDATRGLELMSLWKNLLEEDCPFGSPYAQLVMEVVIPAVISYGTNAWNPRDPEPMLKFLELWEKLLPQPALQTILDNVVMPKLSQAVGTWDPRVETVSIHVWVHPWLPLLGQELEVLYQTIRVKLGNALHAWHPSDGSAYAILSPWKTVFDPDSWECLITRYIVPKLEAVLEEFQVNPAAQNLDQFSWVMPWASMIRIEHMVNMLKEHFFPKWLDVLYYWLCANPKFEEVTQWYLGWKGLLPPELLANDSVRCQLDMGLVMMNQAVEGMEVVRPDATENISHLRVMGKRWFEAQQQASARLVGGVEMDGMGVMPVMSLKEAIEVYTQQEELLFMPKPGRTHNGFQIYGFGTISIYIDALNDKIFALAQDGWSLVTLETLKEMHHSSHPKRL